MISQARLKEVLNYDPDTGLFTWLVRPARRIKIGDVAGRLDTNGYISIRINYKIYLAHRLAILYITGKCPENEVDHINGIKNSNEWFNLRECTSSQNKQNQKKAQKGNKSGLLGVSDTPNKNGTYVARIQINGKVKQIGTFKTKELAYEAYLKAKRELHEFNTL